MRSPRAERRFSPWIRQHFGILFGITFGAVGVLLVFITHASTGYTVQGARVFGPANAIFPDGVGTTVVGSQTTTSNPFFLSSNNGDVQASASATITYNGIKYKFDYSLLCYNNIIGNCPGGASSSSSNPRNISNTSSYADIWFHYEAEKPSALIQANSIQNSITIAQNSSLTLTWGVSNATSCSASGNWSGSKAAQGGSENRNGDTSSPGTKNYTLSCQGPGGSVNTNVSVNVQAAPPTSPSPASKPASNPPRPPLQGSGTPSPQPISISGPDTTSPGTPEDFAAQAGQMGGTITLSWRQVTDNSGSVSYRLERSTDQQNWSVISENIKDTSFTDVEVKFDTHYYYRIRATDSAGNNSEYATADTQSASFNSNASPDKDVYIKDEENKIQATLPTGALDDLASCGIEPAALKSIETPLGGYTIVSGPFQILCKKADSSIINSFNKPITVSWSLETPKNVSGLLEYYSDETKQAKLEVISRDDKTHTDTFTLDKGNTFLAMGKVKKVSIWLKILTVLAITASIIGAILGALYWRYRKQLQRKYDDYTRKSRGV